MPLPRAAHGVARLQHRVFVFGGRHDASRLDDLYVLDMTSLVWTQSVTVCSILSLTVNTDHPKMDVFPHMTNASPRTSSSSTTQSVVLSNSTGCGIKNIR